MGFLNLWWEAIKTQGPITAILGLLAFFFLIRADRANKELIKELRDEVERLVKSRNRLEDILLNNRLSSDDTGKDDSSKR